MAVQFARQSGIVNSVRYKNIRGTNGAPQVGPISFAVIGGGGESSSGMGGAGGFRKSFGTELSGGGSPSESPLFAQRATNLTVTVGAAGGGTGSPSTLGTIISLGGGAGGAGGSAGGIGGSGGGGGGGYGQSNPGGVGGLGTAGQGYAGGRGQVGANSGGVPIPNRTGGGGGGAGGVGGDEGPGGLGLATLIRGSSETFAAGSTAAAGAAPNTGNSRQSGIVIVRYPNTLTIEVGPGLSSTTSTVGSDRVTSFTAGTGNINWSY